MAGRDGEAGERGEKSIELTGRTKHIDSAERLQDSLHAASFSQRFSTTCRYSRLPERFTRANIAPGNYGLALAIKKKQKECGTRFWFWRHHDRIRKPMSRVRSAGTVEVQLSRNQEIFLSELRTG